MGRYIWGEGGEAIYDEISPITSDYTVDQHGSVYDEHGDYFCMWVELTESEKAKIRKNKEVKL
jgi:hypothetical protein